MLKNLTLLINESCNNSNKFQSDHIDNSVRVEDVEICKPKAKQQTQCLQECIQQPENSLLQIEQDVDTSPALHCLP